MKGHSSANSPATQEDEEVEEEYKAPENDV